MRRCASTRSLPGLGGAVTGSGVFARRFWSTLPPRSRLDCASTSGREGRSRVLALTSTTSSGWLADFHRCESGNLKCMERSAPCSRMEIPTAAPSTRSSRLMVKCNLTSILQAFHILELLASLEEPARERALQLVDAVDRQAHARPGIERGK